MDTKNKLSFMSVFFHWSVGLLMMASLAVGLTLEEMERSPEKMELMAIHTAVGLSIILFAAARIMNRISNGKLEPLTERPKAQRITHTAIMHFLMMMTILMPISGILMKVGAGYDVDWFGTVLISGLEEKNEIIRTIGKIIHGLGSKLLILAIAIHIGAAILSAIKKEGYLSRILGRKV